MRRGARTHLFEFWGDDLPIFIKLLLSILYIRPILSFPFLFLIEVTATTPLLIEHRGKLGCGVWNGRIFESVWWRSANLTSGPYGALRSRTHRNVPDIEALSRGGRLGLDIEALSPGGRLGLRGLVFRTLSW